MKTSLKMLLIGAASAIWAMSSPPDADAQQCMGRTVERSGPKGKMRICLDGRYGTCMSESKRLGWPKGQSKAFCDLQKKRGFVS